MHMYENMLQQFDVFWLLVAPASKVYDVRTTDQTSTSISLAWQEPELAYGHILHYDVAYTCDSCDEGTVCDKTIQVLCDMDSVDCTALNITELNEYWNHTFEISASNSMGSGSSRSNPHIESTLSAGALTLHFHYE